MMAAASKVSISVPRALPARRGAERRWRRGAGGGGLRRLRRYFARGFRRRGARRPWRALDVRAGGFRRRRRRSSRDVGVAADAANGATQRLHLPNGKDVDVKIPVGIMSGQHIRLKGQGMAGQAGAGDLLITVNLAPHPIFTLDGADVRLELPITLYEAALGAKVRVPTLDKPVEITMPPWTSSGRTFRLKGKGFPAKAGRGDLLATIRIVLPEKSDRRARSADEDSGGPTSPTIRARTCEPRFSRRAAGCARRSGRRLPGRCRAACLAPPGR